MGIGLHGFFILANYQFFELNYLRLSDEKIYGPNLYPIVDRILFLYFLICYSLLLYLKIRKNIKEESRIRKNVLELSTKHTRLEVKELSEITKSDIDTIKGVALEMIENNEVYAQFFSSSKSVVFNQEANTEEIDRLMSIYEEWEEKQLGKT
jgi:hypothetical protein